MSPRRYLPLSLHSLIADPLRAVLPALVVSLSIACAAPPPLPADERADEFIREGESALVFQSADDAALAFEYALRLRPDDPRALHGMWKAALLRGDLEAALVELDRMEALAPGYVDRQARREHCESLSRGVEHFLQVADSPRALQVAARLERSDCGHPEAGALRASALMAEAGRVRQGPNAARAVAFYQQAFEADPSRVDAYVGAGEALLDGGRYEEALSLLSDALAHHPESEPVQALMLRALTSDRPGR